MQTCANTLPFVATLYARPLSLRLWRLLVQTTKPLQEGFNNMIGQVKTMEGNTAMQRELVQGKLLDIIQGTFARLQSADAASHFGLWGAAYL